MKKSIVIISYYYHPQITPRAFRAKELASEFIRREWDVTLIIPRGVYRNQEISKIHDTPPSLTSAPTTPSEFKKNLTRAIKIRKLLPGGKDLKGACQLIVNAASRGVPRKYDMAISIGLPFSTHIATSLLKKARIITAKTCIADYGDPFTAMEKRYDGCLYAKQLEQVILKSFDYITVPIAEAADAFKSITEKHKIITCPQGLRISQFTTQDYIETPNIIRFSYAGQFYEDIRNPTILFKYLENLDLNFEFHVYTNQNHEVTAKILKEYKEKLKGKLVIHAPLPRDKCIYELSSYDFLINIENEIETQTPSKLIDYGIARRPIYSFKPTEFKPETLIEFLCGNYKSSKHINTEKYEIKIVVDNLLRGTHNEH